MQYHILGKSDLKISKIGFGCMSLGDNHAENSVLLQQALDGGINFFDTADLYQKGFNESTVGKAFAGKRDQVILATKVGNQWWPDGSGWDWNPTKAYILKAVDKSLQRLQTDYIDLYQLHGGTLDDPIDETIEAFEILKKEGKIRHYGISSIRPNVIREWVTRSGLASVMMQYSLLDRRPEETVLELLQQKGVGVLARGSLAKGLLAGKAAKSYLAYSDQEVAKAASAVEKFSTENHRPAAVAAQFALQQPAITSAVIGIRTARQLQEALQTASIESLKDKEIEYLRQAVAPHVYEQHR